MTPDTAIHRHGMAFPPTREHLWRAADGMRLAVYDWKAINPRGVVLLVHGLGEHAMRYTHVAAWFVARGYAVRAYDQFGHGHSDGARGALLRDTQLVDHLAELVVATEAVGKQLILGHSLGGLVAATAVARGACTPDRLLLSSPALAIDAAPWQRVALALLPRLLPDLRVGNGLRPEFLAHDAEVVRAYVTDPLVHDRICARLGAFVAGTGAEVIAAATHWDTPTLLAYAGDDQLVNPRGSHEFAAAAPRSIVRVECFETMYHEIFNEPDAAAPFAAVADWLETTDQA